MNSAGARSAGGCRLEAAARSAQRAASALRQSVPGSCTRGMYSACRDTTTPWDQLISSTMTPTTAVAVKLAVTSDDPEPDVVETPCENGGLLTTLHKHLPSLGKLRVNKTNAEHGSPLFR